MSSTLMWMAEGEDVDALRNSGPDDMLRTALEQKGRVFRAPFGARWPYDQVIVLGTLPSEWELGRGVAVLAIGSRTPSLPNLLAIAIRTPPGSVIVEHVARHRPVSGLLGSREAIAGWPAADAERIVDGAFGRWPMVSIANLRWSLELDERLVDVEHRAHLVARLSLPGIIVVRFSIAVLDRPGITGPARTPRALPFIGDIDVLWPEATDVWCPEILDRRGVYLSSIASHRPNSPSAELAAVDALGGFNVTRAEPEGVTFAIRIGTAEVWLLAHGEYLRRVSQP